MSDADETSMFAEIRKQKREATQDDAVSKGATKPAPDEPVHVESESQLDELIESHSIVLVEFQADWCGPCKMFEPIVTEIAAETEAAVASVNIDDHQELAVNYQIKGVPTLYILANGEQVKRLVGVQDKGTLVELIEQFA
ncbi:MAG: thioredoxin family protein [Natronomonas sp.]